MKKYFWLIGLAAVIAGGVMYFVKYNSGDQVLSVDTIVLVVAGGLLFVAGFFVRSKAKK
jgi:Na+/melibiose symporter-like transporter